MKLSEQSLIRLNLGLLIVILCAIAKGAWVLSEMNTKVDALWSMYGLNRSISSNQSTPKESSP